MIFSFDFDDFLKPRIGIRGKEKGGIGRKRRKNSRIILKIILEL